MTLRPIPRNFLIYEENFLSFYHYRDWPMTVLRLTVVDGRGILSISAPRPPPPSPGNSEFAAFESMLFLSDNESARLGDCASLFSWNEKTTLENILPFSYIDGMALEDKVSIYYLVALTGAAQLRADGISSCCYVVNIHNHPSWATSRKEAMVWYSSRPTMPTWHSTCHLSDVLLLMTNATSFLHSKSTFNRSSQLRSCLQVGRYCITLETSIMS